MIYKFSRIVCCLLLLISISKTESMMLSKKIRFCESLPLANNDRVIEAQFRSIPIGSITRNQNQITKLWVDSEWQDKSVGSHLFITCLDSIKQDYNSAYWLAVNTKKFYERFGARSVAHVPGDPNSALMEFSFIQDGNPRINIENYLKHKN